MGGGVGVMGSDASWEFWIDRGGTFTDCVALEPTGALHVAKVLSSDEAPVQAIRQVLERAGALSPEEPIPPCVAKVGSTVATNALLERRGVPVVLVTNRGLSGVFQIRTQERPSLFALDIQRPSPVHSEAVEIAARVSADGREIEPFDPDAVREALGAARRRGAQAVAVSLIHAYAHPEFETAVVEIAREVGFDTAVASHQVAREMGLLARGETAAVDAYLTPLLVAHVEALRQALGHSSRLRFMQSSGGLTSADRFRGPTALLSGPAGGVVAAARVAQEAGFDRAIGFDMGGTSTDVSLVHDGVPEHAFESAVGGVRVLAPMLRIHTVAAGGGSVCRFDGFRLAVGPESTGAEPGPLCYGGARSAEPENEPARADLAITDANFFLGRVQADRFPFPLARGPVERALESIRQELGEAGFRRSLDEVAAGFVEVANARMAQAIQKVSVARGVDPRDHVLVGFGGAGGQHVCAIARELGISTVLLHPLAGLLSAYGIGISDLSWDRARDVGRLPLDSAGGPPPESVERALEELEREGREALGEEGLPDSAIRCRALLDLRYRGTDTALSIARPEDGDWRRAFEAEHRLRFGYLRAGRSLEIVTARVRASGSPPGSSPTTGEAPRPDPAASPAPLRQESIWFAGEGRRPTPVYAREALGPGCELEGPLLVLEETGTVVVEPGFRLEVDARGVLRLSDEVVQGGADAGDLGEADPVRLEVFGNRFMSIAEQMGAVLRNTAVSTNIKDRLDYSCAVFDAQGGLVANAPHIPVHLGAMGETVRVVCERFPGLQGGDAVVTNDPFSGGSHLPDVTLVTPVCVDEGERPLFFVASRGHHADIGGRTPGSMPPDSQTLAEEGVVIEPFRVIRGGQFDAAGLREKLTSGTYPSRRPEDNRADLEAMVAANRAGARLVQEFVGDVGRESVETTMRQLQRAAAAKVAVQIARLADGEHRFEDCMDDGTPVCVRLEVSGDRMVIDFDGTGPASRGNLNAPRAVVMAAVIYVLRALVDEEIPLNGGCLDPVEIRIPRGCLLDPPPGSAVVGGNVETSQRVVDVLLGALGKVAASQGTMNNVTFGNEEFGYYETLGGGAGAGPDFDGASGVHTHMTNTRITDPEVLESRFPVRLLDFGLREGSGGAGRRRGGDGLVRRYEFTAPVEATLLCERRRSAPFGLAGGEPGQPGRNWVERRDGHVEELPGRCAVDLEAGDRLLLETPGGGGFGDSAATARHGDDSNTVS